MHITKNLQDSRAGQVATIAEIGGSHHVLWVVHLLGQLWDRDGTERVSTTASKGSKANHEEMETREGNHIDGQLSEIRVELTRETETGCDTRPDGRDQVVEISVRWVGELESSHADVVQSLEELVGPSKCFDMPYLVINTEGLVRVLNQLMN